MVEDRQTNPTHTVLYNELTQLLLRCVDFEQCVCNFVDKLNETCNYALITVYKKEENALHLLYGIYTGGVPLTLSTEVGVIGRTLATRLPQFVPNIHHDADYFEISPSNINSEICVPIFYKDEITHILNVEQNGENTLSEEDFALIQAVANLLSVAYERAMLQSTLADSQRKQEYLHRNIQSTATVLDENGVRLSINNPSLIHMLGNDPSEYLDKPFFEVVHPEDVSKVQNMYRELVANHGSTRNIIYRVKHASGQWHWINSTFTNHLDEPSLKAIVANSIDITDQKELEEAFNQSQKMDVLGLLAGGIAHDFNNLLTVITGQLSVAKFKSKSEIVKKHLDKAQLGADRAANLTKQLLAYAGQGQFKQEAIDLNQLVIENNEMIHIALPKSVEFRSELAVNLPLIWGDITQVQQILMNLVFNSAEAMGEQEGSILIKTNQTEISIDDQAYWSKVGIVPNVGAYVEISVIDTGHGMSPSTLESIFSPFYTTKVTGRGLGLAAVKGIVQTMGGGIFVSSELDKGTQFSLYFPPYTEANESRPMIEKAKPLILNMPMKVLVIDDESDLHVTFSDMLEYAGITAVFAYSGQEGIRIFSEQHKEIDLIILDLVMPGMTGDEALPLLHEINPNVPILLSSGYMPKMIPAFNEEDIHVAGFLKKPYDAQTLLTTIHRLTGQE